MLAPSIMRRARKAMLALCGACLVALAAAPAGARKPAKPKPPPPPTADQQAVVAQIVNDTFPRPKRAPLTLALCLDLQFAPALPEDDDNVPVIDTAPRRGRKKGRKPEPPPPPVFSIQGAPPELVERLVRPWRLVASASACRLDPRQPYALNDEHHTAAQLVTVHLVPEVATGTIKIDWTDGHDPTTGASRDCTAARGPRGWDVRCGGTWFQ
jgi:hypothetical protein